jgi:hypothetical protein
MNDEQNDMLIRIDERVQTMYEAKLVPRMNRMEGVAIAVVAIATIIGVMTATNDHDGKRQKSTGQTTATSVCVK